MNHKDVKKRKNFNLNIILKANIVLINHLPAAIYPTLKVFNLEQIYPSFG